MEVFARRYVASTSARVKPKPQAMLHNPEKRSITHAASTSPASDKPNCRPAVEWASTQ